MLMIPCTAYGFGRLKIMALASAIPLAERVRIEEVTLYSSEVVDDIDAQITGKTVHVLLRLRR